MKENIDKFIYRLQESLTDGTFVKMSLGDYKGSEEGLKNIYIKRTLIKKEEKLSFTYRYKTRDIVKNYDRAEAIMHIEQALDNGFSFAAVFTTAWDLAYKKNNNGKSTLKQTDATATAPPSLEHDRAKNRLVTTIAKSYLHELGITDREGKVHSSAWDKYRQIDHFVQIVSSLIKDMELKDIHKVADMGCGKGYLTFALYDYLANVLKADVTATGVEYRKDLVDLCNGIATKTGFKGLHFAEGSIADYDTTGTDILIALHACDTATDDAIYKGIKANAGLIMVAPCCHKQVRREMEKNKAENDLDFLTRYGIFMERQAEMVTDGIRALILEYHGYTTKVIDFIADAYTPKNVMIVGVKNNNSRNRHNKELLMKLQEIKAYFGIGYHHLERIAGLELAGGE